MIRLGAMLIVMAGCTATEPPAAEPDQRPHARTQSEIDEDIAAGRQWALDQPVVPAPMPDWWSDEPIEDDGSLVVCLKAVGESQAAATVAVSEQLLAMISERYGDDASVEVDVTQNLTPLAMGGVRLAARFRITPVEDPDG